jgi:hypothetical protein
MIVPFGYAAAQVLVMAVEATKSLDHSKVAEHLRSSTFKTVVGDVSHSGKMASGPSHEQSSPNGRLATISVN